MGGIGSGTWYRWDKRTTAEEVRRIDIRYLRKEGLLKPGLSGNLAWSCSGYPTGSICFHVAGDQLVLNYRYRTSGQEWQDTEEQVWFDRTPCHYGGSRLWFLCPHCSSRVAVLYGTDVRFLCRHCYDLAYDSQTEAPRDRWMRKARKIRRRLGASNSLGDMIWDKPKGMHWPTFERLREQEQALSNAAVFSMASRLGLLK